MSQSQSSPEIPERVPDSSELDEPTSQAAAIRPESSAPSDSGPTPITAAELHDVVPIEALAHTAERDVVPIQTLAPDPEAALADTTLPGWEQWEESLAAIGAGFGTIHPASASLTEPAPFPTDDFGFLDLPTDYVLAAARGVADPAEWPTDEEWRRAGGATPVAGTPAVGSVGVASPIGRMADAAAAAADAVPVASAGAEERVVSAAERQRASEFGAAQDVDSQGSARALEVLASIAARIESGSLHVPRVAPTAHEGAVLALILSTMLGSTGERR